MEEVLSHIIKEASGASKFAALCKACKDANELLEDPAITSTAPEPYELREKCLVPLKIALESRNSKIVAHAIEGIQSLLQEERFQSSLEAEEESKWLPMQVLDTITNLGAMNNDTQVEVLKLLLHMTFTSVWCTNAKVVTRISDVLISAYGAGAHGSVKTAARATITQLLSSVAEKFKDEDYDDSVNNDYSNDIDDDDERLNSSANRPTADREIADFLTSNSIKPTEDNGNDIVYILYYLCTKITTIKKEEPKQQTLPLVLEGIHAMLSHVPTSIQKNRKFLEVIWQQLCPTMIALLGNPLQDKNVVTMHKSTADDRGRGSGCSSNAPPTDSNTAKILYNMAVELVRLVASLESLRPVIESVLHRMLLYPPPIYRLEAIKSLSPILINPSRLLDLAGPTIPDPQDNNTDQQHHKSNNKKKKLSSNIAPLKLIVDSLQECCHCNDSAVCMTSVGLISDLVKSLDKLAKGQGIDEDLIFEIHKQCMDIETVSCVSSRADLETISVSSSFAVHDDDKQKDTGDTECDSETDFGPEYSDVEESRPVFAEKSSDNDDVNNKTEGQGEVQCQNEKDKLLSNEERAENQKTFSDETGEEEKRDGQEKSGDNVSNGSYCDNAAFQRQCSNSMIEVVNKDSRDQQERQNARKYIRELVRALPDWLTSLYAPEVDEMIQRFSSDVCAAQYDDEFAVILNADGVYVVTYSILSLNLKLIRTGYYESEEKSLPLAEQQFVDELLDSSELMLYLSPYWLSEVFLQTIQTNFLEAAGYRDMGRDNSEETALIQLITDLDGLGSRKIGGQLLCSAIESADVLLSPTETEMSENPLAVQAGMKFARKILLKCGDAIVDVLSVLINGKNSCGITSSLSLMFNAKEESRKARETICLSLGTLQTTAKLACTLGVQERCGAVFQELVAASCIIEEIKQIIQKPTLPLPNNKPKLARLHAAHSLSLDLVLTMGLEMGSHSKECWKHVFRCCAHITELEHMYFSSGNTSAAKVLPSLAKQEQQDPDLCSTGYAMDLGEQELFSPMPLEPVAPTINVTELIQQSSVEAGWDSPLSSKGILSSDQASKILCGLSQKVDRLFEDATNHLNMKALVDFLSELCNSSQRQLNAYFRHMESNQVSTNSLHLYRLGDVMLNCIRGERPLLHIMKCWAVVAPHLIEAACHRDRSISKKAVTCIHEIVTWLLSNRLELPYFHLHESLCKPYENLLCLELCDGDVQDQIVCSICELVEACTTEIKSGWRPLFGALRAVKIKYTTNEEVNEARQRHVTAVLDVFEVFLNTDNVLVFAYAAVDCILCLLKYVRGPSEFEEYPDDDSDSSGITDQYQGTSSEDLILPALKYLKQCCEILSSMWEMPASPAFHGASSIQTAAMPKCVDPSVPGYNLEEFQKPFFSNSDNTNLNEKEDTSSQKTSNTRESVSSVHSIDSGIGYHYPIPCSGGDNKKQPDPERKVKSREEVLKELSAGGSTENNDQVADDNNAAVTTPSDGLKSPVSEPSSLSSLISYKPVSLSKLDNNTGVLRVWFLVLEGLATTLIECPKNYQPQTVEMFITLLKAAAESPGPEFSLYCVNHLVLPTLQNWIRKGSHVIGYWNGSATANFKHCMGLCADLVVEYIVRFASEKIHTCASEFMLHQLLIVLTECVAQPFESLSRLGCACIRHSLLSCGPVLSESMWHIAMTALKHACDISLYCLRQLMTPFHEESDNFYGDIGQVKVAVRKDCSGIECERIRQLAQQVFLLDSQRDDCLVVDYEKEEDRSYIFLIYPPVQNGSDIATDDQVSRVPFRSLVVGLLSHQILVQTIGTILLQGCKNVVDNEKDVLSSSASTTVSSDITNHHHGDDESGVLEIESLPGMMRYLSCRNILMLLQCLRSSFMTAQQFDLRPGLKFLMQKVARCQVAANLYKQTGLSTIFYVHTLLEISANQRQLHPDTIKHMLWEQEAMQLQQQQALLEQQEAMHKQQEDNDDINNSQNNVDPSTSVDNEQVSSESKEQISSNQYDESINEKTPLNQEADDDNSLKTKPKFLDLNPSHPNISTAANDQTLKCDSLCATAENSTLHVNKHLSLFVYKLKEIFDTICTTYIDMYLEKEGPNAADKLSTKLLVFLLAPEELPSIKRDKTIKELVEEKLRQKQIQQQQSPLSEDEESQSSSTDLPLSQHHFLSSPVPLEDQQEPGKSMTDSMEISGDEASPTSAKYGEDVDKVYDVATDKTIQSLMHEYKKRKHAQTMPTFVKQQRSRRKFPKPKIEKTPSTDPVDKKIEEEHKNAMVKDSDAQLISYVEVLCNLIQLFLQLTDDEFKALLPTVFNFISQLTCHCRHRNLRESLARWTFRIGHIYDFTPPGIGECPKAKYE